MTDISPKTEADPGDTSGGSELPDASRAGTTPVVNAATGSESTGDGRRPLTRMLKSTFRFFTRTDRETHGYVPFLLWITLLFGGFWFPATPFLDHVFNDAAAPINNMFGTTSQRDELEIALAARPTAKPPTASADGRKAEPLTLPGRRIRIGPGATAIFLPVALVFWSWTNLALLCVMASAMGEVNRTAENVRAKQTNPGTGTGGYPDPDYRTACTRAFFVYLFVLMNEIAIAGTLSSSGAGDSYKRVAILASATCFLASYRPEFFRGLIGKFAAKQEGDDDEESTDRGETKPEQPAPAKESVGGGDEPDYDRQEEFAATAETA